MAQLSDEDLERIRRSIAMLTTREPSGLTRESAMDIIEELQRCRRGWRRLAEALGEVLEVAQHALGRVAAPGTQSATSSTGQRWGDQAEAQASREGEGRSAS